MNAASTQKVALVTGGAQRIGKALSLYLAKNGWSVAIHCNTSTDEAEALKTSIETDGGKAFVIAVDLTDRAKNKNLIPTVSKALNCPVSLLINNASTFAEDSITDFTQDNWDLHMEVNLHAPLTLMQSFANELAKEPSEDQSGNIINIVDQRVWNLNPQFTTYTLSKAGLWTLTQTAAQALAPKIRVNAIGPGPTLASIHQTQESFNAEAKNVLLEKGPALDEITNTIGYILASPSLTGQMIALDGGQHLSWETPDIIL